MKITMNPAAADSGRTPGVMHPVVLLVSDAPRVVDRLQRRLAHDAEIELQACAAPGLATRIAQGIPPTLLLRDLETPDREGDHSREAFRNTLATTDTPVSALSEREDPHDQRRAFENGASDYRVKIPDGIEGVARLRVHTKTYLLHLKCAQE